MRSTATISVDLDPVDLHLLGYGFYDLPPDPVVYTAALPRLVEAFTRASVRATFFVVGRDAQVQAARLRALESAGHEVASHSMTHPMPLARVTQQRLELELGQSRRRLSEACGAEVMGFRAPNWDMAPRLVGPLARAGYRYDASGFPSLLQIPARLLLTLKARDPRAALSMRLTPFTLSRHPFRWRHGGEEIHEFPISVTPGLRVPIYHTMRYLMGERRFLRALDGLASRGESLYYPLHGVDALGLVEDRVDPRLARHPGMEHSLDHKLALIDSVLNAIAARFDFVTYRDRISEPAAEVGRSSAVR